MNAFVGTSSWGPVNPPTYIHLPSRCGIARRRRVRRTMKHWYKRAFEAMLIERMNEPDSNFIDSEELKRRIAHGESVYFSP